MIARTWHGAVPLEKSEAYHAYLLKTGVPDLQATAGNQGVYVMRRAEGELAHFLMISLWDSLAAIRAFAGDDVEVARYYPEDRDFLLELAPNVTHYEVLTAPE
jgi:heme-degrading monooxygenase HmoA